MTKVPYRFAVLMLLLEIAILILFGFFVRYDEELGMPVVPAPTSGNGSGMTMSPSLISLAEEKKVKVEEHISHYYAVFQDIHVMMFIGFGFLMTFLKKYGFSSVGLNFLVAAFVLQWSTLVAGWIQHFDAFNKANKIIHVNLETMINAEFASAAILISFGAVLGKVSPIQLVIMALLEVVVYEVNELIVFHYLHATDTGDSMVVHVFGAYFGLMVSRIIYKKDVEEAEEKNEGSVYHSDLFAMIGTVFLWLFWPSFNAGTAVDEGRLRAIINTYYALTSSAIVTFAISSLVHRDKFNMVHVQNSTLAGGVAIGTLADLIIQPWAAILVGIVAGTVSVVGFRYLTPFLNKYLRVHDTCGVNNLHGMPGLISGLGGILAAGLATDKLYGNGLKKIFSETERGPSEHAGFQAAALGVSLGMALAGGAITGLVLLLPIWDQPRREEIMSDEITWHLPEDGFPSVQEHSQYPMSHFSPVLPPARDDPTWNKNGKSNDAYSEQL